MPSVPFYLSFVGVLFPSDKDTVRTSLQAFLNVSLVPALLPASGGTAVRDPWHNAPGLSSLQSFVFFSFH